MRSSPVTRGLNAIGSVMPDRLCKAKPVLAAMGPFAGAALRAGRLRMLGDSPNGQHFIANPLKCWLVGHTSASRGDVDFGPMGPLDDQAALGDFRIPQRGMFVIGRAYFWE